MGDQAIAQRDERGPFANVARMLSSTAGFERDNQHIEIAPGFQIWRRQRALKMTNAIDQRLLVVEFSEQAVQTNQHPDIGGRDAGHPLRRELGAKSKFSEGRTNINKPRRQIDRPCGLDRGIQISRPSRDTRAEGPLQIAHLGPVVAGRAQRLELIGQLGRNAADVVADSFPEEFGSSAFGLLLQTLADA